MTTGVPRPRLPAKPPRPRPAAPRPLPAGPRPRRPAATARKHRDEGAAESTEPADGTAPEGSAAPAVESPSVGLLFDITGRGDRSFNDAAAAGLDQAVEELGATGTESTPSSDGDRAERLAGLLAEATTSSPASGSSGGRPSRRPPSRTPTSCSPSSTTSPSTTRARRTTSPTTSRWRTWPRSLFAEEQGSFLVGAAAALKTQTDTVGFIGGVETDLIKKFEAGFIAGVEAVNPDIEVLSQYITQPPDFNGFNDPARGKEIAASMYSEGADVIYAAAGGSGLGVFQAASEAGEPGSVWAIGVDSDQYNLVDAALQPYILTSMLKKVDVAVFDTIEALTLGEFRGGPQTFDLASGGVDYSTSGGFVDDIADQLDEFKQQIIDGEIEVPTTP